MPNVQAPDGTVVNFPDSMSQNDIAAVMRQHFPPGGSGPAADSPFASGNPSPNGEQDSAAPTAGATINLQMPDGSTATAHLDAEDFKAFQTLPQDQQHDAIEEMARHAMALRQTGSGPASQPPSYGSDLQGGLHDLGTDVAEGAKVIGGVMQRNGMPDWGGDVSSAGDWVQQHTPDAPAGPAPSDQLAGAIKNGNWRDVPGLALHAALRALPSAVPIIAAGALTDGAALPALMAGGEALGPEAYARAANNDHAQPTTGDVVSALPGVAGEALGGALLPGESKLASPIGRSALRVAQEALGGAVMDTSGQLGATVGTDKGASLDPYEVAASALSQGAIGAGRSARELAGVGIKSGVDQAMARTLTPPASQADAESVLRVVDRMDRVRQAASNATGRAVGSTVVANTVKQDLASNANRWIALMQTRGADPSDIADLRNLVNNQALRHNNTTSDDADSLLGRVDSMNLPATDDEVQGFKNAVRDLNTVSTQSFINQTVGPFQRLGSFAGRAGALGYGVSTGHLPGIVAGVIGDPMAAKVGGVVGAGIDRKLGTNTPPIILQRINAARVLRSMGVNPADVTDPTLTGPTSAVTGLPPNRVPVNTPIPAGRPLPAAAAQPQTTGQGLQVSTSADVATATAEDDASGIGLPAAGGAVVSAMPRSPVLKTIDAIRAGNAQPAAEPRGTGLAEALGGAGQAISDNLRAMLWQKLQNGDTTELGRPSPVLVAAKQAMDAGTIASREDFDRFADQFYGQRSSGSDQPAQSTTPATGASGGDLAQRFDPAELAALGLLNGAVTGRQDSLQGTGTPAATAAPASASATPAPSLSLPAGHPDALLWERLVANGNPNLTRQQVRDAAGRVYSPDQLAAMDAHRGGFDLGAVRPIQAALAAAQQGTVAPARQSGQSGQSGQTWAVDRSEQARTNARGYQQAAAAYATLHPEVGDAVLDIAQRLKTPAEKRAAADAYVAAHPEALGKFPEWLLDHGKRD